ncbi:MAG: WYL domain-containing protein [Alistipes sp.]|nr:WYL domain-containing protein [Alistipes sp.]
MNNILHESQELKNRILLDNVPSGQQHLTTIVDAMRESVALTMTYHSFHREEPSTFEVEPYCVKLFEQRWYMLGKSEGYDELRLYALDRIKALEPTERKFKLPKKFDAAKFFEDYYGIIIGDEEFDVCPVALKVDSWQSKYLRTLPLHHSQVEVERNEEFSIFNKNYSLWVTRWVYWLPCYSKIFSAKRPRRPQITTPRLVWVRSIILRCIKSNKYDNLQRTRRGVICTMDGGVPSERWHKSGGGFCL